MLRVSILLFTGLQFDVCILDKNFTAQLKFQSYFLQDYNSMSGAAQRPSRTEAVSILLFTGLQFDE